MTYFLLGLMGYLIGNIPCSYVVGRLYGNIDVRKHGSGNAGATNVLRTVGKKAAFLALFGDILKGLIPALMGRHFGIEGAMIASICAVMGHCYPVFMGFKGGKGVATAGGMIIGTNPLIALGLFIYMVLVIFVTKFVSLASVTAAIIYPIVCFLIYDNLFVSLASSLLGLLLIYKHRSNIGRLIKGVESKTSLFDKK